MTTTRTYPEPKETTAADAKLARTPPAPHAATLARLRAESPPVPPLETGVLYRNRNWHVRAVHAWHPTLISLGGQRLLATFDLGQAVESLDYRTYSSFSGDGGIAWSEPRPLLNDRCPRRSTHTIRPSMLPDGTLAAVGGRFYRDDLNEGICNRANMGLVEMDLFLLRSDDMGESWSAPEPIKPPLVGPGFEVAHGVVELSDGRWLWPTSTWKGWNGEAPNGMKGVALISYDRGRTWPEYVDIFDAYRDGVIHFEQSLVVLADGRLLACAWALDERTGQTRDVVYSVSDDGRRFTPPRSTGLPGETSKLVALPDGRAACFFRSLEEPGLGAAFVSLDGDRWHTERRFSAWQGHLTAMFGERNAAEELAALRLGYPSPVVLPDGALLCAFWCRVDEVNEIRWVRWEQVELRLGSITNLSCDVT